MDRTRILFLASLAFAAVAFVAAGAHLAELPAKIAMSAQEYLVVQQIYRGWALFGIAVIGALASIAALALCLRGQPGFRYALAAFLCIAATQAVFWTFTFPVNRATVNWTVLPADWQALRAQWEYSHAASAVLNLLAVLAIGAASASRMR